RLGLQLRGTARRHLEAGVRSSIASGRGRWRAREGLGGRSGDSEQQCRGAPLQGPRGAAPAGAPGLRHLRRARLLRLHLRQRSRRPRLRFGVARPSGPLLGEALIRDSATWFASAYGALRLAAAQRRPPWKAPATWTLSTPAQHDEVLWATASRWPS